jgi:tetratricopeptide (TPR) repeat protein
LQQEPDNIDAINSVAQCVKLQNKKDLTAAVYAQLQQLYQRSLDIDAEDVEANFNMGLLHLQHTKELNKALSYFKQSVAKDGEPQGAVYRSQFAKAFYNIGMIEDKLNRP